MLVVIVISIKDSEAFTYIEHQMQKVQRRDQTKLEVLTGVYLASLVEKTGICLTKLHYFHLYNPL